jgi:hypothetical protein
MVKKTRKTTTRASRRVSLVRNQARRFLRVLRSFFMRGRALLVFVVYAIPGFAWGPEGHRLAARLAENLLTPAAAARVHSTLAPGETITALSSWADEIRKTRKETEPWHFVDIPIDSAGLDMKRDCPQENCIIGKIAEFRKRWRDETLSPAERREALLFLVHFVGDMHQPLHCANNQDRGGNDVTVQFEGARMNLHHLWDSGLLDRMPAEEQLFTTLAHSITPDRQAAWSKGNVEIWAGESSEAARNVVYGDLPRHQPGQIPALGETYEHDADAVVERQLEKAAVRLAAILNEP